MDRHVAEMGRQLDDFRRSPRVGLNAVDRVNIWEVLGHCLELAFIKRNLLLPVEFQRSFGGVNGVSTVVIVLFQNDPEEFLIQAKRQGLRKLDHNSEDDRKQTNIREFGISTNKWTFFFFKPRWGLIWTISMSLSH